MAKKLQSIGSKRTVRRKRKPKLQSQGFIFPRKVAVTLALALSVCMGFIYLYNTNKRLGREIKVLEGEYETAKYKALNQLYRWQDMSAPENIEKALQRFNLDMRLPEASQVVTVDNVDQWLERGAYAQDNMALARRREIQ